jgi:GntR family transcriptional repressor for pyruvate dehydrogenase complex|tara:strand:- start:501 stop:1184 length:684 start_codon:yes stop_codon:yes gene_type:complete
MNSKLITTITDSLISDIKSGKTEVGQMFSSERELSIRFSTSRPSIREALIELEKMGYAKLSSKHRPRADLPTVDKIVTQSMVQIRSLLGKSETASYLEQLRQFIELGALRTVIEKSSTIKLSEIHSSLLECHEAVGDLKKFISADIKFHQSIVAVVENPILISIHRQLLHANLLTRKGLKNQRDHDLMVYGEHSEIYKGIHDGNSEKAVQVMEKHLSRSFKSSLIVP